MPSGSNATSQSRDPARVITTEETSSSNRAGRRDGSRRGEPRENARDDARSDPPPPVIVILVDTLRADHVGAYGAGGDPTPTIDALAAEGTLFERAVSQAPWTLPSVGALFTGVHPSVHGATRYRIVSQSGEITTLSDKFDLISQHLTAAGNHSAAFVANRFVIPMHGFERGFAHFDRTPIGKPRSGRVINEALATWLEKRRDARPPFLYLHYMEPHAPYEASAERIDAALAALPPEEGMRPLTEEEKSGHVALFRRALAEYVDDARHQRLSGFAEYWEARYSAAVREADQRLAELRETLQKHRLWDEALIILTSDHGEALGEHAYWGHGMRANEHQLHVPLIVRLPGGVNGGRRISRTVQVFDVMPTVLDMVGLPIPPHVQAASLRADVEGRPGDEGFAFSEAVNGARDLKALTAGEWKLLAFTESRRYELYHLASDPGELRDVSGEHPDQLSSLLKHLERQMSENEHLARGAAPGRATVKPDEVRALEAIGYAGVEEEEED